MSNESRTENEEAIDKLIANLNRIPKRIDSEVFVKDIENAIMKRLRQKIAV